MIWVFLFVFFVFQGSVWAGDPDLRIWADRPAAENAWSQEAYPLGNGALGAMVFGQPNRERVQFNENTLWIGDEKYTGAYQPFGDLFIETGHEAFSDYSRTLDLQHAVEVVEYTSKGIRYRREYFVSDLDGVLAIRFSAEKPASCSATIQLKDAHGSPSKILKNSISISGNLQDFLYRDEKKAGVSSYNIALDYQATLLVIPSGGDCVQKGETLRVEGADSFVLLLAAGTDFLQNREKGWKGIPPEKKVMDKLKRTLKIPFDQLLATHKEAFFHRFNTLSLALEDASVAPTNLSTEERLNRYQAGEKDLDLEILIFQYARYLMLSSSRSGGLPANLQGIWCDALQPAWRCDFHSDINIEMNYWFVDAAHLSDCFVPLFDWIRSIVPVRREETLRVFGTRGWLTHAENGAFGGSTWKWSKGDAAWMLQNLFDHYLFTLDRSYLEAIYPLMKSQCEFWVDHLKELPDGTLVSPQGYSPEHGPEEEDGVSFDQQLIWNLFDDYQKAAGILQKDPDFAQQIGTMQKRLLGPKIGKWGQLQEWSVDRDSPEDQHRHISHMIALHPGHQITPRKTPKLAEAARVSMNARGDAGTGWSKAWKINIWARLHDGDRAYKLLGEFIQNNLYPNLFGFHPPFQIDGNFGYAAGVLEMLVQSHMGYVELLPALPENWRNGSIRGVKVRGAFVLDFSWKNGGIETLSIHSLKGASFQIRSAIPLQVTSNGQSVPFSKNGDIFSFPTQPNATYQVVFSNAP